MFGYVKLIVLVVLAYASFAFTIHSAALSTESNAATSIECNSAKDCVWIPYDCEGGGFAASIKNRAVEEEAFCKFWTDYRGTLGIQRPHCNPECKIFAPPESDAVCIGGRCQAFQHIH